MKPQIGISEIYLNSVTNILSVVLSNEMALYIKTRKAHWNVTGENFMELHKLFEEQYNQLEASIDEIAERIGKLGGKTIGTMLEFSKLSVIRENPGIYSTANEFLVELRKDHETIVVQLRKDIDACADNYKDAGTADFLTGLMRQHETTAWILRRYTT